MRLSVSVVYFTFLNLHNAAAQSQMCNEPFQAVITLVTNVTYPASATFLDSDLVFYRKVLRFTEEIDRETKAAMQFFSDTYGLDFTNNTLFFILSHSLLQEIDLFPLNFQDLSSKMA